jgi:hypothetical protein
MRESRTYGSVRGAPSDGRPYRDRASARHDDGARPRFGVERSEEAISVTRRAKAIGAIDTGQEFQHGARWRATEDH